MTPPSECEVNQIIEIKLVTVCGGGKKSLYSVNSQAIKTYV